MKSLAERRVCGLCGAAFVIVMPPGEELTDRDKLCNECATLPAPPPEQPSSILPVGNVTLRKVLKALRMKLKALRSERGWTQTDLAKRAHVSAGYIARLETSRHDPKLSTLVKIAKALGVPVTELLE